MRGTDGCPSRFIGWWFSRNFCDRRCCLTRTALIVLEVEAIDSRALTGLVVEETLIVREVPFSRDDFPL